MLSERSNHEAANALLDAADAVECIDGAGDIADLAAHLDRLGDALRAAGRAYEMAATHLVAPAQPHGRGITSRYQRAAAAWPGAAPPSHERFAAAMTSLHAATAAARAAGRRSDEARQAIAALWQPGDRH
jgi:hypothetical protein